MSLMSGKFSFFESLFTLMMSEVGTKSDTDSSLDQG